MRYFYLVCASLLLIVQVTQAQNCTVDVNNIKFKKSTKLSQLSFTLVNATAYEINLYDNKAEQYLVDQSNITPFDSESGLQMRQAGNNIVIEGISREVVKKSLVLVLVRKDKSCKPVKVDL